MPTTALPDAPIDSHPAEHPTKAHKHGPYQILYLSALSGSTLYFAHALAHHHLFHHAEPGLFIGLLTSVVLHFVVDLTISRYVPDFPTFIHMVGMTISGAIFLSILAAPLLYMLYYSSWKQPKTPQEEREKQEFRQLLRDLQPYPG
jgi:hypothetical protein